MEGDDAITIRVDNARPGSLTFLVIANSSWLGISRSTCRARAAWRMSRETMPGIAWPTLAIVSPVVKWTTSSRSRLS